MVFFIHRIGISQDMLLNFSFSFSIALLNSSNFEGLPIQGSKGEEAIVKQIVSYDDKVYFAANDNDSGNNQLSSNLDIFEEDAELDITPKKYPSIAIKLETKYAPGIQTSKVLVREMILWLLAKGYEKEEIFLFDRDREGLIAAGFINEKSNDEFMGVKVFNSSVAGYFHDDWFHDSPLPPATFDRARFLLKYPKDSRRRIEAERRSYLPFLFLKDVYWINMAVPMDDPYLGVDGASANISLGSISNYRRFSNKSSLAAATVTEILAIPEIWEKRLFSMLDFSTYQVANGQRFDAKYVENQSTIFLGKNPIALDYFCWKIINRKRGEKYGLKIRSIEDSLLFKYSEELGLGYRKNFKAKVIK